MSLKKIHDLQPDSFELSKANLEIAEGILKKYPEIGKMNSMHVKEFSYLKYQREVISVRAGDKLCVKYYDRTQPSIMPDGSVGKTDSDSEYIIENCVDIIGMPNKMADEITPKFN